MMAVVASAAVLSMLRLVGPDRMDVTSPWITPVSYRDVQSFLLFDNAKAYTRMVQWPSRQLLRSGAFRRAFSRQRDRRRPSDQRLTSPSLDQPRQPRQPQGEFRDQGDRD